MSVSRVTKVIAAVLFLLAVFGGSFFGLAVVPLGLAVWVLGEAA